MLGRHRPFDRSRVISRGGNGLGSRRPTEGATAGDHDKLDF